MEISVYDCEGRRKYLSIAEGRRFARLADKLPAGKRAICLVLYYTGCRISEALNLTPENLDVATKTLLIHSLKKRKRKSVRRLPIPDSLASLLIDLAKNSADGRFWNFSRSTTWRTVKKIMAEAKIEGIHATAKGLRHGFGVRCALNKIPVHTIQKWMGHSDPKTTAIYLDVQDQEEREMMRRTWK